MFRTSAEPARGSSASNTKTGAAWMHRSLIIATSLYVTAFSFNVLPVTSSIARQSSFENCGRLVTGVGSFSIIITTSIVALQ